MHTANWRSCAANSLMFVMQILPWILRMLLPPSQIKRTPKNRYSFIYQAAYFSEYFATSEKCSLSSLVSWEWLSSLVSWEWFGEGSDIVTQFCALCSVILCIMGHPLSIIFSSLMVHIHLVALKKYFAGLSFTESMSLWIHMSFLTVTFTSRHKSRFMRVMLQVVKERLKHEQTLPDFHSIAVRLSLKDETLIATALKKINTEMGGNTGIKSYPVRSSHPHPSLLLNLEKSQMVSSLFSYEISFGSLLLKLKSKKELFICHAFTKVYFRKSKSELDLINRKTNSRLPWKGNLARSIFCCWATIKDIQEKILGVERYWNWLRFSCPCLFSKGLHIVRVAEVLKSTGY